MEYTQQLDWQNSSTGGLVCPISNNHAVQYFENPENLSESVTQFILSGLSDGEGVVVVSTEHHLDLIKRELSLNRCDYKTAQQEGKLVFFNATETLKKVFVNGEIQRDRLRNLVVPLISQMIGEFGGLRVYGEMVNLLSAAGHYSAVIELEEIWNELGREFSFSLYCGYTLDNFDTEDHSKRFQSICDVHSHVLPISSYSYQYDEEAQNRLMANLHQQALALKNEILRRKEAEDELDACVQRLRQVIEERDAALTNVAELWEILRRTN